MPRHPPFALDNLTTENKMLASTVQFSTNDQPTTHSPPPNPQGTTTPTNKDSSSTRNGIRDQAMPGVPKQQPDPSTTVVLSGSNRVLCTSHQPHHHTPPHHPEGWPY